MTNDEQLSHMRPPGSSDTFEKYIVSVWDLRQYAWRTGQSQVRASNADTNLGAVWMFLEPVFSIAIYWLIFGQLLEVSRGVPNFLAFLTVGQITFGLSQRALLGASASLTVQAPMLRSLAFPRAVLPLSAVFKALAAYRPEAIVMLLAILLMGESVRASWILLPLIAILQALTNFGLGMGLSRVVYAFPDAQRFLTHLIRLLFYASGVFFPLDRFTESGLIFTLVTANPFYDAVALARWSVLGMRPPHASTVIIASLLWVGASLVIGGRYFASAEHTYSGTRTVKRQ